MTHHVLSVDNMNQTGLVKAVFTTRHGGQSTDQWSALNLGLHVGDRLADALANREKLSLELGVMLNDWVCGEQVHGNRVHVVQAADRGRGAHSYATSIPGVDALVTNVPGVVLATFAADCVPILLFDPVQKAIGAIHAGWKGTKSQIVKEAVQTMQREFGSRPEQLQAAIGPAIDACCYEVDQQVFIPFVEGFPKGEDFFQTNQNQKWQLALPDANRQILLDSGLSAANIERIGGCTACRTDIFFSHRAEKGKTGRHAGLIVLV